MAVERSSLRVYLPPDPAAAARRDAIPLRVELDLEVSPPPVLLPALALLQNWCGPEGKSRLFLQLNRRQLRSLVQAAEGLPIFFAGSGPAVSPLPWKNHEVPGLSEFLVEATAPAPSPIEPPIPSSPGARRSAAKAASASPVQVDGSEHYVAVTLPSREHPAYEEIRDLLKTRGFILEPSNRRWWLRDRHKTLSFLAEHWRRFRDDYGAQFTPNFQRNTERLQFAACLVDVQPAPDSRGRGEFEVSITVGAAGLPAAPVAHAAAQGRSYVESSDRIVLLEPEILRQASEANRRLGNDPGRSRSISARHRVTPARVPDASAILESIAPGFAPPDAWRRRSESLRNLSSLHPAPLPADQEARLRPYQKLGVAWLWHLWSEGLGGVLADEMGLGKTRQAIALIGCALRQTTADSGSGMHLIVAPASLLENWRREFAAFDPRIRVRVHHGAGRDDLAALRTGGVEVLITSYGTLNRDREILSELRFATVVADEAQHIKNRRSQNAGSLRMLHARSRFLLTGTPLENSLEDLRSLFDFLLPGYLTPAPREATREERAWQADRLKAQAAPYILRRTKEAVAPELPGKIEQIVWCEFGPAQAARYRALQEETEKSLIDMAAAGAGESSLRLAALTQLLRLRQLCCDPRLLPASDSAETGVESAKLEAFRELLAEALDDGHRILVFSQFTAYLALVRSELESQSISYCYLDGSLAPAARQAEVDRFQRTAEIPVFLLSLKAAGVGLNLTAADTVVHLDPWWNPAAEAQATDRAHRIGQTKTVTSYRLVVAGSVEERVLALQEHKRNLLAGVFEASEAAASKLSLAELQDLLR